MLFRESQVDRPMTEAAGDLLLHPVRLRIVQALAKRPMTSGEVKDLLGDVPQATLYRHMKALERGGLLEVVAERQARGTVERTYRVVEEAVVLGADELAEVGIEDHFRYFATFAGTLLSDFATYLNSGRVDLGRDRVGYRQVPLWLSDEEFDELAAALRSLLQKNLENEPGSDRRRRLITTIVMPDDRSPS